MHFYAVAAEVFGIKMLDGSQTFFTIQYFDRAEPTAPVCEFINDDLCGVHHTLRLKKAMELALAGPVLKTRFRDQTDTHFLVP
jgi:hypothetical protein